MAGFSENIILLVLLGFFILQFVFAGILGKILLKFSANLGVRNHGHDVIRWTSTTKPSLGGILFFFSFLLSSVFYLIMLSETSRFNNLEFLGMVASCTLGFVMGLADDAYNTRAVLKFFVQLVCAVVSVMCGNYIHIFPNETMNYIITVFWFVGIMNSLNMLDNMDAITASVTAVTCIFMLVISYISDSMFMYDTVLIIGVAAALLAFLRYNWHPSKMYMGDSGSQFIGAFMAYAAIKVLWNISLDVHSTTTALFTVLLPVSFFIITISDTSTVFINRLFKRRSPFIGGKDHTTHHLVYAGLKQQSVALLYLIISFLIALIGSLIYYFHLYNNQMIVIIFAIILFSTFLTLFFITKKYKNESA